MPIRLALQRLRDLAQAIVPDVRADLRFDALDESRDAQLAMAGTRRFALHVASLPEDDGEAGGRLGRLRAQLVLRVRYRSHEIGTRGDLDTMLSCDVRQLVDALSFNPTGWQPGTTGIDGVLSDGRPAIVPVPPEAAPQLDVILELPFRLIYHEEV